MLLVQGHALRSKGLVHTALLTGEKTFPRGSNFPKTLNQAVGSVSGEFTCLLSPGLLFDTGLKLLREVLFKPWKLIEMILVQ